MFKLLLRSLMHYKLYSAINILGLAISLTGVIIISRYVYNELSTDSFNSELSRIHVIKREVLDNGDQMLMGGFVPAEMRKDVDLLNHSGVQKYASMIDFDNIEVLVKDYLYTTDVIVTDSVFMQIFDFPLIAGRNIAGPEDVLITESFAQKTFGNKYPVGEKVFYPTIAKELTVVGIIGKLAHKSSISFDIAISNQISPHWGRTYQCFVLLYPDVNYNVVNELYSDYKEQFPGYARYGNKMRYQLFPYRDIYFDKAVDKFSIYEHGNYIYVLILSAVGGLLLLTAIINYVNIHAVIMRRRSREFGMKKIFGAGGLQIFRQLLCENLIVAVLAVVIALLFAELLKPFITNTLQIEQFPFRSFDLVLSVILAFVLPLTASVTPCIRYHYSMPLKSLRTVGSGNRSPFSGKFFLCFQYFITFVMIVLSLFFIKQLNFMLNYDLGYRTENIIKVPFMRSGMSGAAVEIRGKSESIAETGKIDELYPKLNACTLFEHWTNGKSPHQETYTIDVKVASTNNEHKAIYISGNKTWFEIFGFHLVDGRMWEDMENDVIIASEFFLKQFGITDWKNTELDIPKWNSKFRIIGVVKDVCVTRLSEKQIPVIITPFSSGEKVIASFLPERKQEVIEFMKNLHNEIVGGEFSYSFVEDEVADMYKDDKRIAVACSLLTGFAIFVSALGVFGLSLFDIRQRRREIAIRKINGAQIIDIIQLLLKKYFVVLSIGFAVSIPVALFAIHKYLENFANKASISWWLFAVALVVTLAVSLLTLLYQTYKAGNENPAEVIKSEV